ncbi:MAG: hypothetical protein ABIJ86_13925, partial [Spirochaetota bacterium]
MKTVPSLSAEQYQEYADENTAASLRNFFYALLAYIPVLIYSFYLTFIHEPCIVFLPYLIALTVVTAIHTTLHLAMPSGHPGSLRPIHRWTTVFLLYFLLCCTAMTAYHNFVIRNVSSDLPVLIIVLSAFYYGPLPLYAGAVIASLAFFLGRLLSRGDEFFLLVPHVTTAAMTGILGVMLSRIINQARRQNFAYRKLVEQHQRELLTLNASLQDRIDEQLGLILRSGNLKKYLPAQVVDRILQG